MFFPLCTFSVRVAAVVSPDVPPKLFHAVAPTRETRAVLSCRVMENWPRWATYAQVMRVRVRVRTIPAFMRLGL